MEELRGLEKVYEHLDGDNTRKKKQIPALVLALDGKAQEAALELFADISSKDGVFLD